LPHQIEAQVVAGTNVERAVVTIELYMRLRLALVVAWLSLCFWFWGFELVLQVFTNEVAGKLCFF